MRLTSSNPRCIRTTSSAAKQYPRVPSVTACQHSHYGRQQLPRWRQSLLVCANMDASGPLGDASGREPTAAVPAGFTTSSMPTRLQPPPSVAADALQFLGIAVASVLGSYWVHPYLLTIVTEVWQLKQEGDASFENSFFGLVGIIYGLMAGNSFLFLYERQVNIVQELYGEAFALELLLQQSFLALPDTQARNDMAECLRAYIVQELYDPVEMTSPFDPDSTFSALVTVVTREKEQGYDVTGVVEATQKLADAQSRRSAVAAQVLPNMHWVFLHALQLIFVVCFLVFDASNDSETAINPERRLAFSALVGVLVLTQQVLYDLNNPIAGLYSFRPSLDARLTYVVKLLHQLERSPRGFIPPELARLNTLGLIGAITHSEDSPSTGKSVRRGRRGPLNEDASYTSGALHNWHASWTADSNKQPQDSQVNRN